MRLAKFTETQPPKTGTFRNDFISGEVNSEWRVSWGTMPRISIVSTCEYFSSNEDDVDSIDNDHLEDLEKATIFEWMPDRRYG